MSLAQPMAYSGCRIGIPTNNNLLIHCLISRKAPRNEPRIISDAEYNLSNSSMKDNNWLAHFWTLNALMNCWADLTFESPSGCIPRHKPTSIQKFYNVLSRGKIANSY